MKDNGSKIQGVPTNIITGFLGVGKTTTILHLLKNIPKNERWAILVNEFGEIGVDGSLIQGQHGDETGVIIREVPGGCMCCAAGLPMQVALTQLLSASRPNRLLIEPTGLGHPTEILQVLRSGPYRNTLSVHRTVTLVDARNLTDERYTDNEIFNQQITVSDVVVANKSDLYQFGDEAVLRDYVVQLAPEAEIIVTTHGKIGRSVLAGTARFIGKDMRASSARHRHHSTPSGSDSLPECGFIKKQNHGNGFHSAGWRFSDRVIFNREALSRFLSGIDAERVKAVVNTEDGVIGYNLSDGALAEIQLFGSGQSCVEIIADNVDDGWETTLLQCIDNNIDKPRLVNIQEKKSL